MINMLYVAGVLFEIAVSVSFFDKMLTRRMDSKYIIFIWAIASMLNDVTAIGMWSVLRTIITVTEIILVISFMYIDSFKKKLIVIFFMHISVVAGEGIAMMLLSVIGIGNDKEYFILGYVLTKILYFIFTRAIIIVNKNSNDMELEYKSFFSIFIVPTLSIVILVVMYIMKNERIFGIYDLIGYVSILIINYITVIQYDNLQRMVYLDNKNKIMEKESIYYVHQNRETKELWEKTRSIRHNMKNEYIMDKILLEGKRYDELAERYDRIISEIQADKNISDSGNVYIDSIINYKAAEIQSAGGQIECKVAVPERIDISEEDIVIILGNMMDNIKDAFMEEELNDKRCKLTVIYDEPNLILEAENNYAGKRIKNKRDEYITTKKDKYIHGVGLGAIKRVVENYKGNIKITDDNNTFVIRIILQL